MAAIVSFFLQFVSALHVFDRDVYATTGGSIQTIGIAGVLVTSAILIGTALWARRRWGGTPFGTYTLMFGGCALLMSGLSAFASVALVVPIAVGGLVADLLERRGVSDLTLGLAVPAAMWLGWFGAYQLVWGLGWAAELWMGTVVFTMVTGAALSQLTIERRVSLVDPNFASNAAESAALVEVVLRPPLRSEGSRRWPRRSCSGGSARPAARRCARRAPAGGPTPIARAR